MTSHWKLLILSLLLLSNALQAKTVYVSGAFLNNKPIYFSKNLTLAPAIRNACPSSNAMRFGFALMRQQEKAEQYKIKQRLLETLKPMAHYPDIKKLYRCEADEKFTSPSELEITELYVFGPNGLTDTSSELTQADALYLLKYALFETVILMDASSKGKPLFSIDQDLGDMVERLLPEFNKDQLLTLPDEIGFAASIDFKPDDEIGVNAAKLLIDRPNLQ